MGKVRIITIICWIITAVVLTGLVLLFLTGTIFGIGLNNLRDGWSFGFGNIGWESITGPYEVDGTYSVGTSGVDSIKIDWVGAGVTIKPHDDNDIKIIESAQRELRDNEKLSYSMRGNTLEIKFRERNRSTRMPPKILEVFIPRGLSENLDELTVNTVSGNIDVIDINAATLEVDAVSGHVSINGGFGTTNVNNVSGRISIENEVYGSIADLDTVSGTVYISGALHRVKVNSVSGNITAMSTLTPASFKSDTVSGSVTITVPDNESVSVHHSSVSGKFSSEIPVTMQGKGAQFEISTVSGSAIIKGMATGFVVN